MSPVYIRLTAKILESHSDVLRHTMSEYGYHTSLADYLLRQYIYGFMDRDAYTRMRLIVYAYSPEPKRVLEKWMKKVEFETRVKVFIDMCREAGGQAEPLPCSWYNSYCEENEDCVYVEQPIMASEDIGMYCCRSAG